MLNRNGSSSASSHFEFSADWSDAGSSVGAFLSGAETEMPLGFSISGASKQQDIFASGGKLSKLVESQAASLGSSDSISGGLGKPQSDNSKSLRYVKEPDIVSNSANNCDNTLEFVIALGSGRAVLGKMLDNAWDGDGVTSESWLVEAFVDDLVKFGISSSWEEWVKLNKWVVTLMRLLR